MGRDTSNVISPLLQLSHNKNKKFTNYLLSDIINKKLKEKEKINEKI
jgi:hypothetical protein